MNSVIIATLIIPKELMMKIPYHHFREYARGYGAEMLRSYGLLTVIDSKVKRCNDGVVVVTIKFNPRNLCVINAYMPTRGPHSVKNYEACLDQLREIVTKYQDNDTLILCGGDLNGHPTKNVTGRDRLNSCLL